MIDGIQLLMALKYGRWKMEKDVEGSIMAGSMEGSCHWCFPRRRQAWTLCK